MDLNNSILHLSYFLECELDQNFNFKRETKKQIVKFYFWNFFFFIKKNFKK